MTTNQILLMQNLIDKLEAENNELVSKYQKRCEEIERLSRENAELKKDLAHEIDMACQAKVCGRPTREQIAALVKGLEWKNNAAGHKALANVYGFKLQGKAIGLRYVALKNSAGLLVVTPDETFDIWELEINDGDDPYQLCEAHHRETVLSLLNL